MRDEYESMNLADLNKTELSGNKKQLFLPGVPTEYVRSRLTQAFASPISHNPGFPLARIEYEASMAGDHFGIVYTSYGRSTISHTFYGQLVAEPNGTLIEFTCEKKALKWQIIPGMLIGPPLAGVALYSFGLGILAVFIGALLIGAVFGIVIDALIWASGEMTRSIAESSVRGLLQQIIYR